MNNLMLDNFSDYIKNTHNVIVNVIKPTNYINNKINCVLGVYLTEKGQEIEKEMVEYLQRIFNLYIVEQVPSDNTLYEYPAIKYVELLTKETNNICLYIHTKGAGNYHQIQDKIRNFRKHELTLNLINYIIPLFENYNQPVVTTTFTGSHKITWFNLFFVNPNVFNFFTVKYDPDRHYYEQMFTNTNINTIGVLRNDINEENINIMFKYFIY